MPINVNLNQSFTNIVITNNDSNDDFLKIKNFFQTYYLEPIEIQEQRIYMSILDFWYLYRKTQKEIVYEIDIYLERIFENHLENQNFLEYDRKKNIDITYNDLAEQLRKSGFKRPFLETQLRDIKEMIKCPSSANFSVPGAGKSTTLLGVNKLSDLDRLFVVVPNKEVMESWIKEVDQMNTGSYNVIKILSNDILLSLLDDFPKNTLILSTYNRFLQDEFIERVKQILIKYRIHMVLDESHRIKGAITKTMFKPSKTGKNILSTSMFSSRRDILSGTPIPHSVYDIVSQFEFLYPNCGLKEEILQSNNFSSSIGPLFTRTVKNELRLREVVQHEAERIPMSITQAALYELIVYRYRSLYKRSNLKTIEKIKKAPVRQIWASVDPHGLVSQILSNDSDEILENIKPAEEKLFKEILERDRISPKMYRTIEKTMEIVENGEQVIIWSQFSNVIRTLSDEISKKLDIDKDLITLFGETPDTNKNIELFNKKNNEFKVLVANPKKGGEGINLHWNCWNAIYIDRSYDCAKYLQSRDRIHRVVGLEEDISEPVNYYIFESWHPRKFDLIDRKISENLKSKLEVMYQVLNDKDLIPLSLGEDEIEDIEEAGLIDMKDIKEYIDTLELEYNALSGNSCLEEYLNRQ